MSSFVFIDSRVADIERLLIGFAPDTQVVILDPALDGVTQIAAALAGATDLDSIHIISHGSAGTLYLGSTILTEDNLGDHEEELAAIGEALSEEGDVLLYGCSVGAGAAGKSFIASLSDYTGADVAASDDATGSAALGGDWVLEASTGAIETVAIEVSQFEALLAPPSINTAGGLDTTFGGGGGIVTTPIGEFFDIGRSVLVQADGKILVGGNAFIDDSQSDFALVRYNADGTLDLTFGGGDGIVTTAIGAFADSILGIAVQADGRIVAAGNTNVDGAFDYALARYETDGDLDTTFGTLGITTISIGLADSPTSMVLLDDGRIVVAGYFSDGTDEDFALARFTANGLVDTTFGGGIVTTAFDSGKIFGIAIQDDGKIVGAGSAFAGATSFDFALARYNTDGTLDDTFDGVGGDGNGIITTPVGAGLDRITSIVIQPDGKILVAGWSDTDTSEGGNTHFALARYNTDGTLDLTFDEDGIVITPIGSGRDEINSLVLQTDGKIVVSGLSFVGSNSDFVVARYNTDGTLDNTFAGDGIETFAVGSGEDIANSVALQPDGAVVVVGNSVGGSTDKDFALIRVLGGPGIPDVTAAEGGSFSFTFHANTFADDGPLTYTTSTLPNWLDFDAATRTFSGTPGSGDVGEMSITVTATDGTAQSVNDIFVLTVEANDAPTFTPLRLDPLFGTDGKVITEIGTGSDQINGVVVQPDGKIVVGGISSVTGTGLDFALARYNTDGTLDATFGSGGTDGDGVMTTPIDTGSDLINAVVLQDGKILVVGASFNTSGSSNDFALARYNTNGTLDASFGSDGNGIVVTEIGTGSDQINAVVLQDSKILVAGFSTVAGSGQEFCIARYGTDGALDAGFGTGGKIITSIGTGTSNDVITSLALQADGKIVVAGYGSIVGSGNDFALARYNTDGTLDATFDGDSGIGNGIVTTAVGAGASSDQINGIAIQADGKIVVGGITASLDFALARYNIDGTLDETFDGDGKVTTGIDIDIDSITSLVLQTDGKIVVAGVSFTGSNNDFAVARYNTDGSLDLTFDDDGKLTLGMGASSDRATSIVLQPDGSIVIGGNASGDFGLVRFRPFIEDKAAPEDSAFSFTPDEDTFVDPEGHALAYSATLADGSPLSTTWLSFNSNTRTFEGTPENDDVGTLAVKLIATDNWGASSSTVFNINVTDTNDAPTLENAIEDQTAQTNTEFSFTIPADTFEDIDDVLTYDATLADGSPRPDWIDIDPSTGELTITPPDSEFLKSHSIKVIASDEEDSAFTTFTLSIPTGGPNADSLTGTAGADTIDAGGSADTLNGLGAGDSLIGGTGNDTLNGGAGADTLNGGTGADSMVGGADNDIYIVDNASDALVETNDQDIDQVRASATYVMPVRIEVLDLTGSFAIDGTGNNLDNQISGNSGANRLDGGLGQDTLTGEGGNDTYIVDLADDQIVEGSNAGNDLVKAGVTYTLANNVERLTLTGSAGISATGNSLDNTLTGNTGANTLNGQGGNDAMAGGGGNDTYVVNSTLDTVSELLNKGTDLVQSSVTWTLGDDVEDLLLTGSADRNGTGNTLANDLTGNGGDNSLVGGAGNDSLDGGAGNDTLLGEGGNDTLRGGSGTDSMVGGSGNDVFYVDTGDDVVVEADNGGTADQVVIGINFTEEPQVFQLYDNIERVSVVDINAGIAVTGNDLDNLFEGSNAEDSLDGAAGNDTIEGLAGDDTLEGGTGVDSMLGGGGSDLYYVDDALDEVIETGNAAPLALGPVALDDFTDTVIAVVNYSLSNVDYVENLTLSSTATSGTGNGLNNVITGNSLANTLAGLGGADTLVGSTGKDTLSGGLGADLIRGSGGNDRLTGEAGADSFEFNTTLNSTSNLDRIMDFVTGVDEIVLDRTIFTEIALGPLAKGAYYEGTAAHDAGDRIIYNSGNLYYDSDGTGAAVAKLFATLAGAAALDYSDFSIVP